MIDQIRHGALNGIYEPVGIRPKNPLANINNNPIDQNANNNPMQAMIAQMEAQEAVNAGIGNPYANLYMHRGP
jgi:hypothetical protein